MTDSGFSLAEQRVLVTGASSGIGAAIASRLANAGATVVVVSRSGGVPESKGTMYSLVADLSEPEETDTVIERTVDMLGGLDILVNNAGRGDSMPFVDVDREYFNAYVGLNLWEPLRLCQHAYESLAKS
ncbi:MAG: SDR family oxidoreductase, partial [Gammaproteobacteria bacterium]|nr:SDR family oxidoreductase [Gammaproteobacteria bacterium]